MQVRRVTKKTLEAEVARLTTDSIDLRDRIQSWSKYADLLEVLLDLRRGAYVGTSGRENTLRTLANEFRLRAEKPLSSEAVISEVNDRMCQAMHEFRRTSDRVLQSSRDLRIPIPMQPGGESRADFLNGSYSTGEKDEIKRAAREIDAHLRRKRKVEK